MTKHDLYPKVTVAIPKGVYDRITEEARSLATSRSSVIRRIVVQSYEKGKK
jgi:hypothetical protein